MKKTWTIGLMILMAGYCSVVADPVATPAFVPPTPEQIQGLAENPLQLAVVLVGATPEQAVAVFLAVFDAIQKMKISKDQKEARIALLAGTLFRSLSNKAVELAALLAQSASLQEMLPKIAAAVSVVTQGKAIGVAESFARDLAPVLAAEVRQAYTYPQAFLAPDVILALGNQPPPPSSPPVVGREPTALPLAPPLKPEGGGGEGEEEGEQGEEGGHGKPKPAPGYSGQEQ